MAPARHITDPTYEVRFGLMRRDLWMLPGSVVLVLASLLMVAEGRSVGWLGVGLFGLFLLLRVAQVASRRVAFRVDAAGVTMSLSPPWPGRYPAVVPWSDITGIVLWRQQTGPTSTPYVGLRRVEGAPQLPGSARGRLARLVLAFVPAHVPAQVFRDSRQVSGWRLDLQRLEAAVNRFAPQVEIEDIG